MTKKQAYLKAWHAAHPRYASEHGAAYYAAHREDAKRKQRQYTAEHRAENKANCSRYYATHRAEAAWRNMHVRCNKPTGRNAAYAHVNVCERWTGAKGLENFLEDMGPCPENKTLSRYRDLGDYKPGNCAWHTREQQEAENRRR
jgi:hypothetical protein